MEVQRQRPVSASKPGIRRRQNCVAVPFGGRYACEGTPSQATLEQLHDAGAEKLYTTCCIYYDHCDVGKTFNCQLLAVPSQAIINYHPTNVPVCISLFNPIPTRLPTHPTWNPPALAGCAFSGSAQASVAFTGSATTGVYGHCSTHAFFIWSSTPKNNSRVGPLRRSMSPLGLAFAGTLTAAAWLGGTASRSCLSCSPTCMAGPG